MTKCLLDTDTLSELLKGRNAIVARRAEEYLASFSSLSFSVITLAEIVRGYTWKSNLTRLSIAREFIGNNDLIPIGPEEAELAGKISGELDRTGHPIGHLDPFIAATAIRRELALATGNIKHFSRIVDLGYPLILQNWKE